MENLRQFQYFGHFSFEKFSRMKNCKLQIICNPMKITEKKLLLSLFICLHGKVNYFYRKLVEKAFSLAMSDIPLN